MIFLDKLDFLIKKNGLNKHRLSDLSDIPYTTIMGWYKRGYDNMSISTFKKLCDFFGVTMDSMGRDDVDKIEYYNPNNRDLHITKEEEILIKCYRMADDMHKGLAKCAIGADEKLDLKKETQNAG